MDESSEEIIELNVLN